MNECLFCKIINGDIPCYKVYEDEDVLAFLDINPSTDGDLLIIPKKHYENLFDIQDEVLLMLLNTAKKLFLPLQRSLKCDGMTIVQNNGYGQEIKHFHLHLTPRYDNDGLKHTFTRPIHTLEEVHQTIITSL